MCKIEIIEDLPVEVVAKRGDLLKFTVCVSLGHILFQ
jgi:hypothetical protein